MSGVRVRTAMAMVRREIMYPLIDEGGEALDMESNHGFVSLGEMVFYFWL